MLDTLNGDGNSPLRDISHTELTESVVISETSFTDSALSPHSGLVSGLVTSVVLVINSAPYRLRPHRAGRDKEAEKTENDLGK